jgi:hypothetical protein
LTTPHNTGTQDCVTVRLEDYMTIGLQDYRLQDSRTAVQDYVQYNVKRKSQYYKYFLFGIRKPLKENKSVDTNIN